MSESIDLSELEALKSGVLDKLHGVEIDQEEPENDGEPCHVVFFYRGNEIAVDWTPGSFLVYPEGEKPDVGEHFDINRNVEDCIINVVSQLNN